MGLNGGFATVRVQKQDSVPGNSIRPLAIVGFAFHLLLSMLIMRPSSSAVSIFFTGYAGSSEASCFPQVHNIAFPVAFLVLFAYYLVRPQWPRRSTPLVVTMAVCYLIPWTTSLFFSSYVMGNVQFAVLLGLCTGTGQALGYILWQQALSTQRGQGLVVEAAAGTAGAGALYFIVTWFPDKAIMPFAYLSLAVCCFSLVKLFPVGPKANAATTCKPARDVATYVRQNWAPILAIALIGFMWGVFNTLANEQSPAGYLSSLYALGRIASALLVVIYLTSKNYQVDLSVFLMFVLPACISSALLYPLFGEAALCALAVVYYVFFGVSSIALIIFCASISQKRNAHPSIPYCLFFGLIYLASKIGLQTGRLLISPTVAGGLSFKLAVALASVYLFAMLGFALQREASRTRESMTSAVGETSMSQATMSDKKIDATIACTSQQEELRAVYPTRPRVHAPLSNLGLTPREAEIATLLVKGRDVAFICEMLSLSKNTVRSHIKSIYQKAGVHGKQELISLDESTRTDGDDRAHPAESISPNLGETNPSRPD